MTFDYPWHCVAWRAFTFGHQYYPRTSTLSRADSKPWSMGRCAVSKTWQQEKGTHVNLEPRTSTSTFSSVGSKSLSAGRCSQSKAWQQEESNNSKLKRKKILENFSLKRSFNPKSNRDAFLKPQTFLRPWCLDIWLSICLCYR